MADAQTRGVDVHVIGFMAARKTIFTNPPIIKSNYNLADKHETARPQPAIHCRAY